MIAALVFAGVIIIAVIIAYRRAVDQVDGTRSLAHLQAPPPARSPMATPSLPPLERLRAPRGATHIIEYADAFGEVTQRPIKVERVYEEPNGVTYVHAFCYMRQDQRTFRAERILRLRLLAGESGAQTPIEYFNSYPGKTTAPAGTTAGIYVAQADEARSEPQFDTPPSHEQVMERARPGLRALLWLAAADSRIDPQEVEVMLAWIAYRAILRGSTLEWHREAAGYWLSTQRPTLAQFQSALGRMGRAEAARLLEMMEDLMLADGEKTRLEEGRAKRLRALLPPR